MCNFEVTMLQFPRVKDLVCELFKKITDLDLLLKVHEALRDNPSMLSLLISNVEAIVTWNIFNRYQYLASMGHDTKEVHEVTEEVLRIFKNLKVFNLPIRCSPYSNLLNKIYLINSCGHLHKFNIQYFFESNFYETINDHILELVEFTNIILDKNDSKEYDVVIEFIKINRNSSIPALIIKKDYLYIDNVLVRHFEREGLGYKLNRAKAYGIQDISYFEAPDAAEKLIFPISRNDELQIRFLLNMDIPRCIFNFYGYDCHNNLFSVILTINIQILEHYTNYDHILETNFPFLYIFRDRAIPKFPNLTEFTIFIYGDEPNYETLEPVYLSKKMKYVVLNLPLPKNTSFFPLFSTLTQALMP